MSALMRLQVMSIHGIFFDGKAQAVIIPCDDGDREIMAHHEDMIFAIYDGELRIQDENGEWTHAVISIGSCQVANNRVIIMSNTVERPEEIDVSRAQEALDMAREKIRQKNSIKEYNISQATMARALSRIKTASKYNS